MSNENMVQAKVMRPFEGEEGAKWPGDEVEITRQRFADLKANGLVEETSGEADSEQEKSAPEPANKAAAAAKNKSA